MIYRSGAVYSGVFAWGWWRHKDPYKEEYADVRAWFRIPPFGIRFRSEDEALRILCERVDDWHDQKQRQDELLAQRTADLKAREETLIEHRLSDGDLRCIVKPTCHTDLLPQ